MKLDTITNKRKIVDGKNLNDEFYTPRLAIEPLAKYLNQNSKIWCPFDLPQSNFVLFFKELGHDVFCSHLETGGDFFEIAVPDVDYIISNPPYSLKAKVFSRLFSLGIPFAMLVGVVGLFESQERFSMFKNNDFEIMYFNKRISYFRSYGEQKPSINPPFSSVYVCQNILPTQIVFEYVG